MLLTYNIYKLSNYVRMRSTHVVILVQVGGEVVQAWLALHHYQLPVATTHGYLVGLVELPVEVFVLQLLGIVAEKCRSNGKSVEAIARELAVGVALAEVLHAGEVAERRHEVVEGELQVAHLACLHVSGPPCYERNAYAALVALALESAQFAVASEEFGIGAALLVRSVVGGEVPTLR